MSVSVQQSGAPHGPQHHHGAPPRHHHQPASNSLLACVQREASPLPEHMTADEAALDSYTGAAGGAESGGHNNKKRRFHPLRGLRRMFRRKARSDPTTAPEPRTEQVCGEPAGGGLLLQPPEGVHPRSRSASELLGAGLMVGSSHDLQAKRRSGGALSGGSGGGSSCALGGVLSVSHDSVFTADSSTPRGGGSSHFLQPEMEDAMICRSTSASSAGLQPAACHAGVRAELFEAVRRRRGGSRGRGSRSEDDEEDLGLPSSPYGGSPTTADVLMERAAGKEAPTKSHSTCSDGSLLSMGSSEMDEDSQLSGHSTSKSAHDRALFDSFSGTLPDLDAAMSVHAPLSHSAAHHKIAVKPRRTHGAPRHRRAQQVSLPATPEGEELHTSPLDREHKDVCLPAVFPAAAPAEEPPNSQPESLGTPLPVFHTRAPPAGLSPSSPEALLASVMLERQLKSASLPPGLALPPAAATTVTKPEPTVKLSRSQSSSEPPASPPKPKYRRAGSAVYMGQMAELASAAASRSRAKSGTEKTTSPERPSKIRLPEDKKEEATPPTSPVREVLQSPTRMEPAADKGVFYKPPHPKKSEPTSPTRPTEEIPQEAAPVPGPKPRKPSNASQRQRVEPGLVSPDVVEEPSPWATSKVSHLARLAEPRAEPEVVAVRHKEEPRPRSTLQHLQEPPTSLDSLETEIQSARQFRSLSQSPVDSLERGADLKMSSDSLSSDAGLSSASDDPRPYLKHRRPRRPTPDTSDPDEPVIRPVKLRGVSRHSDVPLKSAAEVTSVIRKSASVDSIRSCNDSAAETSTSPPLPTPQATSKKSTSNDSISSFENIDAENPMVSVPKVREPIPSEFFSYKPKRNSKIQSHESKPVDILPADTFSSLKYEPVRAEPEPMSRSPPAKWDARPAPRLSLSTPSVPEFLRLQLNHVEASAPSTVLVSPTEPSEPPKRPVEKPQEPEETRNEISSVRERLLLRKTVVEEPSVPKPVETSEAPVSILNRRPSQVKKMELSIKVQDTEPKAKPDVQIPSPSEKVVLRTPTAFVRDMEAKKQAEVSPDKNIHRFSGSFLPKPSVASTQVAKPPVSETKPIKYNDSNNVTIVSRTNNESNKEPPRPSTVSPKPPTLERPLSVGKLTIAAPKPAPAEKPAELVTTQEVVLRRKPATSEASGKDEQPELFKVFARRSLKLKDTDTWESQGSTQKSRDSDKENEDEVQDKKTMETKASITNNNVTSNANITNNNNGVRRAVPRAINNNNNNNLETEVTMRTVSPDRPRARPSSVADRWTTTKDVQLVASRPITLAPSSAVSPAVIGGPQDKSLTPQVRRRMEQWERWARSKDSNEAAQ